MYPYKLSHDVIGIEPYEVRTPKKRTKIECYAKLDTNVVNKAIETDMKVTSKKNHSLNERGSVMDAEKDKRTCKQVSKEYINNNQAAQEKQWEKMAIVAALAAIIKITYDEHVKNNTTKKVRTEKNTKRNKSTQKHRERRGGMHTNEEDEYLELKSLNISNEHTHEECSENEDEWQFLQKLPDSIQVDEDECGNILFRRNGFGLSMTREELNKCIDEVTQMKTIEQISNTINIQALYKYQEKESKDTAGQGLCAILALIGAMNPQLNSKGAMESMEGRKAIADLIEEILIPSVKEYQQPSDFQMNPKSPEHGVHRDHTIHHLVTISSLLRDTIDTFVEEDEWMYATGVGTIIQAMPTEVVYWQEIGDGNWLSLDLWSTTATSSKRQTMQTITTILKPGTGHVAYSKSHFFNTGEIGANRYMNLLIELVNAITLAQESNQKENNTRYEESTTQIKPQKLDDGSIAVQKEGSNWFMSISKKKARELSRLIPSQIKKELMLSRSTIQINRRTSCVNWSIINGDNYCGYQALHAVSMQSEGKTYAEISNNIQTAGKPYKLITFLQQQVSKLQGINMRNALDRVNTTIKCLQGSKIINKTSWCPTEMIEVILPSISTQSNYWNQSRPPTGSGEWITTYYKKEWMCNEVGLDIVFNGEDHYTILHNSGIQAKDLLEGIDTIISAITNNNNEWSEWKTIRGSRVTRMTQLPKTITIEESDEEYKEVYSKREQKKARLESHGHNVTKCAEDNGMSESNNENKITPRMQSTRNKRTESYGPEYHPMDDQMPPIHIQEIPYPKTQRTDPTAWKNLVVAPSRIGEGLGVYTLTQIPKNTIIMDYVDEAKEVIMRKDVTDGIIDTAYMYANHKTGTYINASNNIHSYCGLVNESFDERSYNSIICESRDHTGRTRVYYKTTRIIGAREEIGTRYSIDGSYWDNSKTYSAEFLDKVKACYNKTIPFQRDNRVIKGSTKKKENTLNQLMSRYNKTDKEKWDPQNDNTDQYSEKDLNGEVSVKDMNNLACKYIYDTPDGRDIPHTKNFRMQILEQHRLEEDNDLTMEISECEEGSDEEHHTSTIHQNQNNVELSTDGMVNTYSIHKEKNKVKTNDLSVTEGQVRKHKFTGRLKRKRQSEENTAGTEAAARIKGKLKNKRGERRIPRSEKNAKRRATSEQDEISMLAIEQLSKGELVEYIRDQRCRHKKALDEKNAQGNQVQNTPPNSKKTRALEAVSNLLKGTSHLKIETRGNTTKVHDLRTKIPKNYKDQLEEQSESRNKKRTEYNEPSKPRYLLNDVTAANPNAFMIARSNLKNNIQGVFAREEIPLKGSRILFEYTSECKQGTTHRNKAREYMAGSQDNKYIINIDNVVIDATCNVSSYCNHVQELLSHTTPFNCKYAKMGNSINIVQISPIAKNEELNIQYTHDGSYWNNRKSGYPDEILKKARKYYKIAEPKQEPKKEEVYDIPNYKSTPVNMRQEADFNLMSKSTLFQWKSGRDECNLRIATLNMNGSLFDVRNGEPQFTNQLMVQCGINILGLTDTRTPTDKAESTIKAMKYPHPKGTAMICFPTERANKNTTRLTTMGGQMIIVDRQWEPWVTHKRSDESKLCLIVSVGIAFQQHTLTIIQVMVPPQAQGQFTMWSRINKYLADKGIKKTPREYVMDTASKWHMNELAKGRKVIIMGDFNKTYTQLQQWQADNNLNRAHDKIPIAQDHPDRIMYTYLRNSTTYSHIDHIYHSTLDPISTTSVGATDHVHIHEKTDHFPIWIALKWPGHMTEKTTHVPSKSIRNQADLDLDDVEAVTNFAKELDDYIETVGKIAEDITPQKAGCIQAAIFAKSAEIVRANTRSKHQDNRPRGLHHRYKDGFSPTFRILQESLHAYINMGRVLNRLSKKTHTAVLRLKELHRIYPRWKKIYDKYCNYVNQEDHDEALLFPLELNNITLQGSKRIDIAERIARIKSRLHGRQRTILRAKLSERCKTMQHNISINKLKKVIQMIIPKEKSALDYAAIRLENNATITDKLADLEANRVMSQWMQTPKEIHYIAQEFEDDQNKWKSLLRGTYRPPDSEIPRRIMNPVINAFRMKNISEQIKQELSTAMHKEFSFKEFNNARKRMAKDKSPGPSGVTNNQMKSWSDTTSRAIFDLSSIMWKHHSVPQFWQDRLMTLLPKVAGVNDLSKIRPISLFENIRKLWAGMVSRRIQTIWNKENMLHANQHGFRWQRGTHTAVIHLLNQLELADSLNPAYLTMWDIRRAFDSVPKWLQRLAWARLGLNTTDLEWFLKLDSTGNIYIRTPEFESQKKHRHANEHINKELPMLECNTKNHFHPERGVGQGDTPSSLIFIAVFDILLTLLDNSGTGQPHAYADDLAHIATNKEDQQTHADLVSAFCVITSLEVATAKVEAIALNHSQLNLTTTLIIRDWWWTPHLVIQSDNDFWTRYLGIYLDTKLCIRHYEDAIKQYRFSCHALIHRTAPSSAKKMVHTLCLRPKLRYVAALSPWSLQQYKQLDKVPYQLFCQVYGLRRGFPLALIYTPISMGGCGDTKISDESNSMKWKILHSCIHLGGLSQQTSNQLIQRALIRRSMGQENGGYADSMIDWCMEMGLTLYKHTANEDTYPLLRLNQILKLQKPESDIHVYSDGAYDTEKGATLIDKLTLTPTQIRHKHGIGKSGIYIEGTLANGIKNRIGVQLTFNKDTRINTTPFLQELIGILVGINISQRNNNNIRAYTDCKSALAKVTDALVNGSKSVSHLPYGSLIQAIKQKRPPSYQIEWIESHPEKKKRNITWNEKDYGIFNADTIASKNISNIRRTLPNTTLIQGDITAMLDMMIPTDTWIWKTNEGIPILESLRTLSSQCAHTTYLNRRDTLRNKGDMTAPSRWNKYNMYLATHLNGTRQKCSTRLRGHQCKQMYDWTTHSVNLAKGVKDTQEREEQARCKLCNTGKIENQIHTSTTCTHSELKYIRNIYRKEIGGILCAFSYIKLPNKDRWIRHVISYIVQHLWGETETTADIWNGRWSRHMWDDALNKVESKDRAGIDIKRCRKWLSVLTTKLFETQSALSRHRFKLMKRLKDPMFERPKHLSAILTKRIIDQHKTFTNIKPSRKLFQVRDKDIQRKNNLKRKNTHINNTYEGMSKKRLLNKQGTKRKYPAQEWSDITNTPHKLQRKINKNKKHKRKKYKHKNRNKDLDICRPMLNVNSTSKTRHHRRLKKKSWQSYSRYTYNKRHRVGIKHKIYCDIKPQYKKEHRQKTDKETQSREG